MDAISLAELERAQPLEPDGTILEANLAALAQVAPPELAERLRATRLPDHWRPVRALDGAPTWRIEPPGNPAEWLDHTAAPRSRAGGLLRLADLSAANPALPSAGSGALVALLLERLAAHRAVYVFEDDLVRLRAVLSIYDLAGDLCGSRCIIVAGPDEPDTLRALLERHPGLLPPGSILPMPHVERRRVLAVQRTCETVAREVAGRRQQRLSELAGRLRAAAGPQPRLAIVSLDGDKAHHALARELAVAAEALGWPSVCCARVDPLSADPLRHCQRLAELDPTLTICVGHSPTELPLRPAGRLCRWHVDPARLGPSGDPPETIHLAGSPDIARRLAESGRKPVVGFYFGCDDQAAAAPPPSALEPAVVIVADLPDTSVEACRIDQPTHKQLWAELAGRVAAAVHSPDICRPLSLLSAAEKRSGVVLRDKGLRANMLRLLEHVLIPAVVAETIYRWCFESDIAVRVVGRGWRRIIPDRSQIVATGFADFFADPRPAATPIVMPTLPGALRPQVLHAGLSGRPLLLHDPASGLSSALARVLQPTQHYLPFANRKELSAALRSVFDQPQAALRRAAQARAHLLARHTWRHRLRELIAALGQQS